MTIGTKIIISCLLILVVVALSFLIPIVLKRVSKEIKKVKGIKKVSFGSWLPIIYITGSLVFIIWAVSYFYNLLPYMKELLFEWKLLLLLVISFLAWLYAQKRDLEAYKKFVGKIGGWIAIGIVIYSLIWPRVFAGPKDPGKFIDISYYKKHQEVCVTIKYNGKAASSDDIYFWAKADLPELATGNWNYLVDGKLRWRKEDSFLKKFFGMDKVSAGGAYYTPNKLKSMWTNAKEGNFSKAVGAHFYPMPNSPCAGLLKKQRKRVKYLGRRGKWPKGVTKCFLGPNVNSGVERAFMLDGSWTIRLTKAK